MEAIVPVPGMSWQQWLPLRKGGGTELLVRVAHIGAAPQLASPSSSSMGGAAPPPQMQGPRAGGSSAAEAMAAGDLARQQDNSAAAAAAVAAAGTGSGTGLPMLQSVLLSSFEEQVGKGVGPQRQWVRGCASSDELLRFRL